MSFIATWMDIEMTVPSQVRERKTKPYDITFMWNLKNYTNEQIYKAETDLTDIESKFMVIKREQWGEGYLKSLELTYIHTTIQKNR